MVMFPYAVTGVCVCIHTVRVEAKYRLRTVSLLPCQTRHQTSLSTETSLTWVLEWFQKLAFVCIRKAKPWDKERTD